MKKRKNDALPIIKESKVRSPKKPYIAPAIEEIASFEIWALGCSMAAAGAQCGYNPGNFTNSP